MGSVRPVMSLYFGHVLDSHAVHRVVSARQEEREICFVEESVESQVCFRPLLVLAAQNLLVKSGVLERLIGRLTDNPRHFRHWSRPVIRL